MDTFLSVLTWGLLWRQLKAASLYVMGNLSLNTHVESVEQLLWGELLQDSWAESLDIGDDSVDVLQGLSAPIFCSVLSVGGTGQVPEGNLSCTGLTLGVGEGLLRVDRCCTSYLTWGKH